MPRKIDAANAANTADTALTRLNVNLNQETAAALKEMAARENISLTETVRRAIAVFKFVEDQQAEGRKIQTMDADEKNKLELVLM